MRRLSLWTTLLALSAPASVLAQDKTITLTITAGKHACENTPICVPLTVPREFAHRTDISLTGDEAFQLIGQLTLPGLTTAHIKSADVHLLRRDLHVLVKHLAAGATAKLSLHFGKEVLSLNRFNWSGKPGEYLELRFGLDPKTVRPMLRYMHKDYDTSTAEARDRTYKVFHHLYDPAGKRLVTNGGQTDLQPGETKKLLYPHHRGLMFAYMRCTYGEGKSTTADTWHAKPGDTHQSHMAFVVPEEAGALLGRHCVLVDWHGPKKEVFAKEERELTVYNVPGGTLVDFTSRLKTTGGTVKLDGDPQHAGFQFRASNDVADKTAKQTYYVRPDGKGKPGETRNWEPKTKKGPINLPWDALSFVLDGKRYTVAYLNHPSNPGESRWSERDYGRFGCYFAYDLTPERPLVVNYRIWLQNGEMTVPDVAALHTNFVEPPKVTVK
ncbi:MAG TPA: DUF6807 family protein [Gemmataceae bacterium]|nr:DUF6807 family protein [Gemmataceae bacterium]